MDGIQIGLMAPVQRILCTSRALPVHEWLALPHLVSLWIEVDPISLLYSSSFRRRRRGPNKVESGVEKSLYLDQF
jgi:hypothetical protein